MEQIEAILNATTESVFLVDTQGLVLVINETAAQRLNQTRKCLIGKCIFDFFPPDVAAVRRHNLEEVVRSGLARHTEDTRGGRFFSLNYYPVLGDNGRVDAVAVFAADITESKLAREKLHNSELFFRESQRAAVIGSYKFDFINDSWESSEVLDQLFGIDEFFIRSVQGWIDLVHPDDAEMMDRYLKEDVVAKRNPFNKEYRIIRKSDGDTRWVFGLGNASFNAEGAPISLTGTIQDITDRKASHTRLQLAASVFSHAREGIIITDSAGAIVEVNDTFSLITGYSREDALGRNPRMLQSGRHGREFYAAMWLDLASKGHWFGEVWNRRKSGEVYAVMLTISAVRDTAGTTQHYVALFSDITTMKEHQSQLEHIAHYDPLTGLPNRVLLADRLHQGIVQCQRHNQSLAVVYLDLDNFKAVNDRYGHGIGDTLLIVLAKHMKEALREADTLARIGGDEFVAVMVDLAQPLDCYPVLERLLKAAATAVTVRAGSEVKGNEDSLMLQVSASIGVTFYPQDCVDADQLLRHADQAMYQAKQAGKNRYHLFDIAQDAAIQTRHESLERIRDAMDNKEFVLYYQPKVNMTSGQVTGAEALIRWLHPQHGLLAPSAFLPIIENHSISVELGEWVIATALAQMTEWRAAGLNIPVSVNISAHQLQSSHFATRLHALLLAHPDVPPGCLELEVLETSALEDISQVCEVMRACQALGVRFALDDFGTGYSSLTYLRRLPADVLKIDLSFVRDMIKDPDDLAIVQGVIGLASAFHREVIAEGVETAAHGSLLLSLGCELAQGYGIARPMPAHDLSGWAANWQAGADWTA
jgi:diguanylate cyclase (GGDEF)-like protein/PAS domain S-box-containing protein